MCLFYSPGFTATDAGGHRRKGGFFESAIHGDAIPADAVPITAARHAELLEAQADGKELYAGTDGTPRYRARRVDADERRGELRFAVRAHARTLIAAISPEWRQLNDMRDPSPAGAARFARIDAVRAASGELETRVDKTPIAELDDFDVASAAQWPENS